MLAGSHGPRRAFHIAATLPDGETIAGTSLADHLDVEVLTDTGHTVPLRFQPNPAWASTSVVLDIEWIGEEQKFVLRALDWTGEARHLRSALSLRSEDGRAVTLPIEDIRCLRITHSGNRGSQLLPP